MDPGKSRNMPLQALLASRRPSPRHFSPASGYPSFVQAPSLLDPLRRESVAGRRPSTVGWPGGGVARTDGARRFAEDRSCQNAPGAVHHNRPPGPILAQGIAQQLAPPRRPAIGVPGVRRQVFSPANPLHPSPPVSSASHGILLVGARRATAPPATWRRSPAPSSRSPGPAPRAPA